MRILVVEDERRLADALAQILSEQKYMVDTVFSGTDGLYYAQSGIYDVIILDVMLPGMNGFDIVSSLRREKIATPVLMLTARGDLPDKIQGLDSGADDYMTKPFATEELLARIRVLSRRKGEGPFYKAAYSRGLCRGGFINYCRVLPERSCKRFRRRKRERLLYRICGKSIPHIPLYDNFCLHKQSIVYFPSGDGQSDFLHCALYDKRDCVRRRFCTSAPRVFRA